MKKDFEFAIIELSVDESAQIADESLRTVVKEAARDIADHTDRIVEIYADNGSIVGHYDDYDDEIVWNI